MTLSAGTRLGAYEILSPIGAGGMGEVYRAHDAKLDRDVAIKVLPASVAADPEALARFEREAKAVAALSHPNILSIFDFGAVDGTAFAAMELLEGETLRAKLAGGPIPQRKAVEYAQQIAQGLAAAHDRGIVHRDLKPENVFICRDGRLKILDFGLVKRIDTVSPDAPTSAPTGGGQTDPGTVMGTVSYMSPEQVKGLAVDHRSDLFSFGAVLYEMLAGERAFKRDTAPETLTAILREEPAELSSSNRRVDPALEGLVRHCLEKSPEERFQSARDLAYALSTLSSSASAVSGATARVSAAAEPRGKFRFAVPVGVLAGLLVGALATRLLTRPHKVEPPSFQALTYSGKDGQPTVSPDGKTIAFLSKRDGTNRIWVKQLAGGAEAALTSGPADALPRFSPDGASLLFTRGEGDESAIYRVPLVGGEPHKVVGPAIEADWSPDGAEIAFLRLSLAGAKVEGAVYRVAADGTNERLVARAENRSLNHVRWSPDGRTIAVAEAAGTGISRPELVFFPVDGTAPHRLESPATTGGSSALSTSIGFAWNGNSRELVRVTGSGEAVRGTRTGRVVLLDTHSGEARTLMSGIDLRGGVEVLGNGTLVLSMGGFQSNLKEISMEKPNEGVRWLTRGASIDRQPVYAPDGEWVAFASNRSGNFDVWEVSTKTGAVRRLTDDPAEDFDPAFSRDGKSLLFSSNRSGHFEVWIAERDGNGARRVTNDGADAENPSMSPDGKWIVYASGDPAKRGIWKIHPDGSGATLLAGGVYFLPEISPDGRLVSFMEAGNRSGNVHFVRLDDGGAVPISITAPGIRANTGRHRWLPGGGAIAFEMEDETGLTGISLQDAVPSRDTSASRRSVTGFAPDMWVESLGVSPDGSRLTVSERQESSSLLLVDAVEGVVASPLRGGTR
jgi:Tol biopolymer transport system component